MMPKKDFLETAPPFYKGLDDPQFGEFGEFGEFLVIFKSLKSWFLFKLSA